MITTNGGGTTPAVDRDPSARPGVPMIPTTARPLSRGEIAQQQPEVPVLVSIDVGELTPVFSSAVPPRGLSGVMRRAAYQMHEHEARRWLVLLLADRVDVWEGRVQRHPGRTAALLATSLAGVVAGIVATRRRRSWWRR